MARDPNEPVAPPVPTPDGGPADIAIGDLEAFTGKGRTLRADASRRLRKNKLAVAGLIWIIHRRRDRGHRRSLGPVLAGRSHSDRYDHGR